MPLPTPNPTAVPVAKVSAHAEQKQAEWEHAKISGPEAALAGVVITALIAVLGWIAVHYLTLKREREARAHSDKVGRDARKRELLAVLRQWEQKFVVLPPSQIANLYYERGGMSEIASATEKFRPDVNDNAAFDRVNIISGMNPDTMNATGNARDAVFEAIRNLIAFVREA